MQTYPNKTELNQPLWLRLELVQCVLTLPQLLASNQQVDFVFLAKIENAHIISSIIGTLFFGKKTEVSQAECDLWRIPGCQRHHFPQRHQVHGGSLSLFPSQHLLAKWTFSRVHIQKRGKWRVFHTIVRLLLFTLMFTPQLSLIVSIFMDSQQLSNYKLRIR